MHSKPSSNAFIYQLRAGIVHCGLGCLSIGLALKTCQEVATLHQHTHGKAPVGLAACQSARLAHQLKGRRGGSKGSAQVRLQAHGVGRRIALRA